MNDSKIVNDLNNLIQQEEFFELKDFIQTEFNIFQILNIETKEIYYSKALSYLLDPFGNHRLGDKFLRDFLKMLLKDEERANKLKNLGIEFIDIDCANFDDIKISTEQTILSKRKLDIFVKIDMENEHWILVIENKINSYESLNQTKNYSDELSQKFSDKEFKKICIFLTPKGDLPSSNKFLSCTWEEIHILLKSIKEEITIRNEVFFFLDQFTKSIEVFIMDNPRLNELSEKLFDKYPELFDYLLEKYSKYRSLPINELLGQIETQLIKKFSNEWEFITGQNWIHFFKKQWYKKQNDKLWVKINTKYFSLLTFRCEITPKEDLKLYMFSYGYDSEPLRIKFKQKFMDKVEGLPSTYNKYVNKNIDVKPIFNFTVLDKIQAQDDNTSIKIFMGELENILNVYVPILDDIIDSL